MAGEVIIEVAANGTIDHIKPAPRASRCRRAAHGNDRPDYDITARKQAEAALRESEERYRVLFEGSTHGILAVDMETGRFGYANPSICRMLGYSDRELLQLGIADIHPKDSLDQVMVEFESLVGNEKTLSAAIPCRRKDGTVFYADIASVESLIQGRRYAVGFFMDVSERRRAEEALRESEATLRTLIEANPESLFLLDTRGVVLAASKVAAQRLGKSLEEIIGADAFALVPPEVGRKRFEIFQQVVATGQPRRFEDVRGDFHLDISMNPIFDQGKVVQVAVLGVDITARKQAEEALRESEQRFRDITENAAEWVWEVDPQGKYTYSSPVVEQLLGYKPEEILGKYFYDFFLPDEREELKNAALAAFAAKQPFRDFLNPNLHKDGRTVQLSTSGIPILDEQGNLLGYRGADIDITARQAGRSGIAGIRAAVPAHGRDHPGCLLDRHPGHRTK